ncbi:hypothetical protein F5884DRAFT_154746 [Xylogone sp. PMI_703]|nr:hypothetical protein F5884DRAFT_154746 [Xylogone sp. PMI_703]
MMHYRSRTCGGTTRILLIVIFCLVALYRLRSYNLGYFGGEPGLRSANPRYPSAATPKSLSLTEEQCTAAFPLLNLEIEKASHEGPFELRKGPDDYSGSVQGRIRDGKLYIISAVQDRVLNRVGAVLHSLHRAIVTSPSPLPNTLFTLNINDEPRSNSWSFSRSDNPRIPKNPWLMPHFSSWSWPLPFVGPLDEALVKIEKLEKAAPWREKINKVVWRGTAWFNPDWNMALRPKLVEVAGGKPWADVAIWDGESGDNTINITDFCAYKYIIYAEGKSYSGRLPFHQACASVILTPPLAFLLHNTHLMRPLFSSTIYLSSTNLDADRHNAKSPPSSAFPDESTRKTWPASYPPSQANIVFVKPDWSDLEDTVEFLMKHPGIGEGIANRQRDVMVKQGYLSEAAEACYWRKLITAWALMARTSESGNTADGSYWGDGTRWETFSLTGSTGIEKKIQP